MAKVPSQFNVPDDFAPVKGRGGRFYCKLCTPPEHNKGQAMTLAAALRHEQHNEKHLAKVSEKMWNDWNYNPPADWGPIRIPEGENAWEYSYPADRAQEFIHYWLDNVAAANRGDILEPMDSFIGRFNKKHHTWLDGWVGEEQVEEPEEPDNWDNIPGVWYSGGSFFPNDDGGDYLAPPSSESEAPAKADVDDECWKLWAIEEDPREEALRWGVDPDELPPRNAASQQQASDATPVDTPPSSRTPPKAGERRSGNRNGRRGRRYRSGQKQQGNGIIDGAGRRQDGRRPQKAKVY